MSNALNFYTITDNIAEQLFNETLEFSDYQDDIFDGKYSDMKESSFEYGTFDYLDLMRSSSDYPLCDFAFMGDPLPEEHDFLVGSRVCFSQKEVAELVGLFEKTDLEAFAKEAVAEVEPLKDVFQLFKFAKEKGLKVLSVLPM